MQQNNPYGDFAVILFMLFVFCFVCACFTGKGVYVQWSIIFGLATWVFRLKSQQ